MNQAEVEAAYRDAVNGVVDDTANKQELLSNAINNFGISENQILQGAIAIQNARIGSTEDHITQFRVLIKERHIEVVQTSVDDVETQTILDVPNLDRLLANGHALVGSSSLQDILAAAAHLGDRPAGPAHDDGLPSHHMHSQGFYCNAGVGGAMTMQPVQIIQQVLAGHSDAMRSNPMNWGGNVPWRNTNGLDDLYDPTIAGNNLDSVPPLHLRNSPVYIDSHFNVEQQRPIFQIAGQMGLARFTDKVANVLIRDYLMLDGGMGFYGSLENSFTLLPGQQLSLPSMITRPQLYDKLLYSRFVRCTGHAPKLYRQSRNLVPIITRATHLSDTITATINNHRAAYNIGDVSEIGKYWQLTDHLLASDCSLIMFNFCLFYCRYSYISTDFFGAVDAHWNKPDRKKYHHRASGLELNNAIVSHFLTNRDARNARAEPFNQNTTGCEHALRSKLPIPIHSTMYLIPGPNNRHPFIGMKAVQYFKHYRPVREVTQSAVRRKSQTHN